MSATILSGLEIRNSLTPALIERIKALPYTPTLAIIQVGNRPDSASYIKAKKAFAVKIGVNVRHLQLPDKIVQEQLVRIIEQCNKDETIAGIVVQLPLPDHLDRRAVIDVVDPRKDVDALTSYRVGEWAKPTTNNQKLTNILPATARGVREILAYHDIDLFHKHICVVGRSELVGKPIAFMCAAAGATVTVCHSKTPDLSVETSKADILIVAVGKPGLISDKHVKVGAVVIDVGINEVGAGDSTSKSGNSTGNRLSAKLVGDVDFETVQEIASAITPVPGGVGPMTVLALFENLVDLCYDSNIKK